MAYVLQDFLQDKFINFYQPTKEHSNYISKLKRDLTLSRDACWCENGIRHGASIDIVRNQYKYFV